MGCLERGWFKGWVFSLICLPKDRVLFIYAVCVCLCTELSEWGLVSAVNVPSPPNWNQTSRFQILCFGGKLAQVSWAAMVFSPTGSPLGPHASIQNKEHHPLEHPSWELRFFSSCKFLPVLFLLTVHLKPSDFCPSQIYF